MRVAKTGAVYCDAGPLPFYFGFVPNEKAWNKEVARLGDPTVSYPKAAGCCTWFENKHGDLTCLVTLREEHDKRDPVEIAGLVAHEAMHVWQKALDHIGELDRPSMELEAYHYQGIFQQIFQAYVETRNPKLFRRSQPARKQL